MKDINQIIYEIAGDTKEHFEDQIDYFDKEQTVEEALYDVVPEYIQDHVIYKEDLDSVKAFCLDLDEKYYINNLKEQALNEMTDDGFIDSLIDGSEEIESYYELDEFIEGLRDENISFKNLPDETWGKLFVAFDDFSEQVKNEIDTNSFVNFEHDVNNEIDYMFEKEGINISDITVGEYIEEHLNEKGIEDLIADVEIDDKGEKESKEKEIEER